MDSHTHYIPYTYVFMKSNEVKRENRCLRKNKSKIQYDLRIIIKIRLIYVFDIDGAG